jgi:hypothetical protein
MTEPEPAPEPMHKSLQQIVDDQIVRGFKHIEWLSQLASVLEIANNKRAGRATPMQHGVVNRIRMAVRYIELLEREARDNARLIAGLQDDLKNYRIDRDLDRHEEGR